jgi:hypothetical protein
MLMRHPLKSIQPQIVRPHFFLEHAQRLIVVQHFVFKQPGLMLNTLRNVRCSCSVFGVQSI